MSQLSGENIAMKPLSSRISEETRTTQSPKAGNTRGSQLVALTGDELQRLSSIRKQLRRKDAKNRPSYGNATKSAELSQIHHALQNCPSVESILAVHAQHRSAFTLGLYMSGCRKLAALLKSSHMKQRIRMQRYSSIRLASLAPRATHQ